VVSVVVARVGTSDVASGRVGGAPRDLAVARLHGLTSITKAAAGTPDFATVLRRTASAARQALGAASLSLSVWERDKARVRVLVNDGDLGPGEEPDPGDETYLVADQPYLLALFEEGAGHLQTVDQGPGDPDYQPNSVQLLKDLGKGSSLGVPMLLEGRVWGELYATRHVGEAVFTVEGGRFAGVVYPTSRRLLEGGALVVMADDLTADPAERAMLDISGDVTTLAAAVRALVACAVAGSPGR
jgi:hypothetical protein